MSDSRDGGVRCDGWPASASCKVHRTGLTLPPPPPSSPLLLLLPSLVMLVASEAATLLEKAVLRSSFSRLGGLQLDKEVKSLSVSSSPLCTTPEMVLNQVL